MSIDTSKLKSILKGALIAATGAVGAYLAGQGLIGGAIASILVNAVYQFLKVPVPPEGP